MTETTVNKTPNQNVFNRFVLILLALLVISLTGLNYLEPQINSLQDQIQRFFNRPSPPASSNNNSGKNLVEQKIVDEQSAIIDAVDKASPAVVSVTARQVTFDPFSGPASEEGGIGTGFIIDSSGLILTNKHVVTDSSARYSVVLKDGKNYAVNSVYRDPVLDLAILKVDASELPTVELGDSSNLKVGQMVVAIGNALGRFTNTVTTGVVSGIGRGITASAGAGGSETLDDVIQTDAALNPGNSGGPLLNLAGQVIAINVAVTEGAQNIGFAIPINAVKPTVDEFRQTGKIVRPYLGVEYVIITEDLSVLRKLPQGAFVQRVVQGTPAEKAGLKNGDIITKVDNQDINSNLSLSQAIRTHKVGDNLNLTIDRNGSTQNIQATLGEAPSQ